MYMYITLNFYVNEHGLVKFLPAESCPSPPPPVTPSSLSPPHAASVSTPLPVSASTPLPVSASTRLRLYPSPPLPLSTPLLLLPPLFLLPPLLLLPQGRAKGRPRREMAQQGKAKEEPVSLITCLHIQCTLSAPSCVLYSVWVLNSEWLHC